MWHAFVQWFSDIIQFLYGITLSIGFPNYGLAIILMTIIIKVLLFPITQKQLKSMRAMQEIQPQLRRIQEAHKEDPQVMQAKIMEVYKEHGVNPLGGCLPLLVQMPIFIAFYQSLYKFDFAVKEHARFLWIPNIGNTDPYYIIAVLAAVTTYVQQKISVVDTKDPTQKSMLYVMPLFMAWIAATMPAGLPLYWVTFNILGIFQQLYVNWSSRQAKVAVGAGGQEEIHLKEGTIKRGKNEASAEERVAGREKGGKKKDGRTNNRKKGKKR
ncbi:MAG: membrane protein insertase YidC [Syntrophomonadaceae bacterium]|nr:membrane protein insertase YidC [Syntrophomonadaceae bacterium]